MRVAEEPFVSRDGVLAVLRPGEMTTERPFRTLRSHRAASPGFAVTMRSRLGRMLGRVHLYSALNADSARAYRLHEFDLATRLARRAETLERSVPARRLHEAVAAVAASMPLDALAGDAPVSLRRYLDQRRHCSWKGLDRDVLAREWLTSSAAWLDASEEREELVDALLELDRATVQARADLISDRLPSVTTFFGIVSRMDAVAAEVEGGGEKKLVPREDLERQGLAVLDQPVALLREELRGGGCYVLPMAAVRVDEPAHDAAPSPWSVESLGSGGIPASAMPEEDAAWLGRELAREPTAVPVAPLPLA